MCTPVHDVESTTAIVGSGANFALFTTGLGTPKGNPIATVIKVSSNTDLANIITYIIDFKIVVVIRGEKTIEEMLEFIIKVANGELPAKAKVLNQNNFIPWRRGVSL